MEAFQGKTKILSGDGALAQIRQMGFRRLLIVADPYFAQSEAVRGLQGTEATEVFSQVEPDPSVELAARGAALVQSFCPDGVVAMGGGSAMDCAKAMVFFSGCPAKLIAVPTTSGSGSEVTDFAILTHRGVKHPLVDEKLTPDVAILDGSLLQQLPQSLIADGGFDLISHALEAMVATGAGKFSHALAFAAFTTGLQGLPRSYAGDLSQRLPVHQAATMAGMAFSSAGLGLCHAMSHALGGAFHLPHGRLNAILLPAVLEANSAGALSQYAALSRQAGLSSGSDAMALRSLKNALIRLRRTLELPESLSQAGISKESVLKKVDSLVEATLQDPCCRTNPVPVTGELVRQVLQEVL